MINKECLLLQYCEYQWEWQRLKLVRMNNFNMVKMVYFRNHRFGMQVQLRHWMFVRLIRHRKFSTSSLVRVPVLLNWIQLVWNLNNNLVRLMHWMLVRVNFFENEKLGMLTIWVRRKSARQGDGADGMLIMRSMLLKLG